MTEADQSIQIMEDVIALINQTYESGVGSSR